MNKPVQELTDSQLDSVSGGGGSGVDPLALIAVANSTESGPDMALIMAETKAMTNAKSQLRTILYKNG
jgi:hypothetical protein